MTIQRGNYPCNLPERIYEKEKSIKHVLLFDTIKILFDVYHGKVTLLLFTTDVTDTGFRQF